MGYVIASGILTRLDAVRDANTQQILTDEELDAIAATMQDPKQCPRCAFGPVDHTGCANLMTHHYERRGAGVLSNACPRCGYFAGDIRQWAPFSGLVRTPAGRAVLRRRVWGETVVAVRATSKVSVSWTQYKMLYYDRDRRTLHLHVIIGLCVAHVALLLRNWNCVYVCTTTMRRLW